ncbi:MAG: hypothetical protein JW910_18840 [Anaerolineae bacterium]|nr:hypothetical protein [Anaerolineae bacterium]
MQWVREIRRARWVVLALLLVLPGLVPVQAQGVLAVTTYAAFQPYEGGYMIWREDTGEIWALLREGCSAAWFAEGGYAGLPDNPVTDATPPDRVRPVSGFGRVWGNFASIRYRLGWALAPEAGYTATIGPTLYSAGGFAQHTVNLPDGTLLVIREDGTWGYAGVPRPIASLPATSQFGAALQRFEGGLMLYWSETGSIWALTGDGRAQLFDSSTYGVLPDNPITAAPPGRVVPILGFGKVWGHYSDTRAALGWALGREVGYLMRFERHVSPGGAGGTAVQFVVNLDDGRVITIRDNGTWAFTS